jgi:hypothetical protein
LNKFWLTSMGVLAAAIAFGQSATILYAPVRVIKDQGISLKGWGAGSAAETDEMAYEGGHSVRVSTRNYFSGGLMTFASGVGLANQFADKNNMLRLTYRVADSSTVLGGGGGAAGAGGGGKGAGGAGLPGGGGGAAAGQGDFGGAGGRGQGPGRGGQVGATTAPQKLQHVRIILTTTDGLKSETHIPVSTSGSGDRGWRTVAIPLQAINGFARTNKEVKELAFAGDVTTTFYIGDIRVVNDTTPISGEPNVRNLNLALGDSVDFAANGYGGSSILKYSWDFDDKDGIQEDAVGQFVKRRFRKPGTYTITLTVSDEYGLKKPYSTTITAKVNP